MKGLVLILLCFSIPAQAKALSKAELAKQAELIKQIKQGKKDLSKADLRGAELYRVALSGTNLQKANLQKANLVWADLSGADLSGADLSGAFLIYANLKETNLSGADLTKASIDSKYRDKIKNSGALNTDKINWLSKLKNPLFFLILYIFKDANMEIEPRQD